MATVHPQQTTENFQPPPPPSGLYQAADIINLLNQQQQTQQDGNTTNQSAFSVVSGLTNQIGRATTVGSTSLGAIPEGRTVTTAAPTAADIMQAHKANAAGMNNTTSQEQYNGTGAGSAQQPNAAGYPNTTNQGYNVDDDAAGAALLRALTTAPSANTASVDVTRIQHPGIAALIQNASVAADPSAVGGGHNVMNTGAGSGGRGTDEDGDEYNDGEYDDDDRFASQDERKRIGRPLAYKGDPNDPGLSEEERRKIKRRIANRESARRVRHKRQELLEDLQTRCSMLTQHNARLASAANALEQQRGVLTQQVDLLKSKYQAAQMDKSKLQTEVMQLKALLVEHGIEIPSNLLDGGNNNNHAAAMARSANAAMSVLSSLAAGGGFNNHSSAFAPVANQFQGGNGMQSYRGGGFNNNQQQQMPMQMPQSSLPMNGYMGQQQQHPNGGGYWQ